MSWITTLPDTYADCRAYGHRWDTGASTSTRLAYGLVGHHLRCERCHTERLDIFHPRTGQLEDRSYHYPDDYKKPADEDRPTAAELRALTIVRRMDGNLAEDEWGTSVDRAEGKARAKAARKKAPAKKRARKTTGGAKLKAV